MTSDQNDNKPILRVRPELFFTPYVVGLTVPTEVDGILKPACYLRSRNGDPDVLQLRERQEFEGCLLVCQPYVDIQAKEFEDSWSRQSRDEWLYYDKVVNPVDVFARLVAIIRRSVDFGPGDEHGPEICSLFILATYLAPRFKAVPYLHLYGNKESGKSTLLNIFFHLVFRAFDAANITPAAMFRWLHSYGGTVLLDEAEQFGKQSDMGRLLNAGYKRGAKVRRANSLQGSEVFALKVLASVEAFHETLASRCIRQIMTPSHRNLLPMDHDEACRVRDELHILALDFGFEVLDTECEDELLAGLKNRQKELWYPLLLLAQWLETKGVAGLAKHMQQAAASDRYVSVESGLPPEDEALLRTLHQLVLTRPRIRPIEVLEVAQREHPHLFKDQRWTAQIAAHHLSRLGVPNTAKSNGDRVYRVSECFVSELMTRHGMPAAIPLDDRLPSIRHAESDDDDAESMAA